MNLISGIANSGIFAQSAYSAGNATNDGLGRNISETYLTGIPDEYATKDYVDSGLSDKYDTSSFSAISADFLIRSGIEYENGLITGYDGSAFKDTRYSAGDNIVIDNDTISVNSSITLMHPNTLRTLNLDGNEAQFVDVSGDAGCIIDPSGMYVSDLNQTEFTTIDKDHVNIRDASGLISIENTGRGPSVYLSRNNGNYDSTVQMYAQNHNYQKYRSYIELTDHDSATSSYNKLDLNTVDITLSHTTDDNDPALNRYYSFTGACNSATSALNILNSSDITHYSAGDFIDITDHVISVTDTAEAESMGIGEGLYIDNSGNLCASATGGANYSAGDHIDITDDTISVTGIEETDSLGLGEHLYIDASGNIDVSATETDSMGIGEGLYLDASGNLCASATGGANYSAGAFIDITDNVISVTDTAEADSMGIGEGLYIDDSGNLCASATGSEYTAGSFIDITDNVISVTNTAEASGLGIGEGLYVDASGNLCASASANPDIVNLVTNISGDTADFVSGFGNIPLMASRMDVGAYQFGSALGGSSGMLVLSPKKSIFSTAGLPSALSTLSYATGAGMSVSAGNYRGFYKGNQIFISNTRGQNASTFSVNISNDNTNKLHGTQTTQGEYGLEPKYVSGKTGTKTWRYGTAEDSALRNISACDMYTSAFGYDSNSAISGYNGSAFAGGSTLPISAGPGIKFELVNNTLVASTDETVLYSGIINNTNTTGSISESPLNFSKIKILCKLNSTTDDAPQYFDFDVDGSNNSYSILGAVTAPNSNCYISHAGVSITNTGISYTAGNQMQFGQAPTNNKNATIYKVVGINRIAGGN